MSKATEVMMQYVENLKRTYEKDHAELMEFKKLANQNSNRCYGGSVETGGKTAMDTTSLPAIKTTTSFIDFRLFESETDIFRSVDSDTELSVLVCPYKDDGVPRPSRSMSLTLGKVNNFFQRMFFFSSFCHFFQFYSVINGFIFETIYHTT